MTSKSLIAPAVALCVVLLGGCASRDYGFLTTALSPMQPLEPSSPWKTGRAGTANALHLGERQVDVMQLLPNHAASTDRTEAKFAEAVRTFETASSEQEKVATRNRVVGQLIDASIGNCNVYVLNVRGSQMTTRLTFDILTGLTSTTGALVAPEDTAKALSGAASFFNGAGASVDRDIFAQTGVELVTKEIDQARITARAAIEAKKSKSYAEWDLGAAMGDTSAYHSMCSMSWGLARLQSVVAQNDLALKAARAAAASVLAKGGTAEQVNAAFAGVAETQINAIADAAALREESSSVPPNTDLSALTTNALNCFDAGAKHLEGEADDSNLSGMPSAALCLPKGDGSWTDAFAEATKAQLSAYAKLDVDARSKQLSEMRAALAKAESALVNKVQARRKRAWDASIAMASNGAGAKEVQDEIAAIASTDPNDPALKIMKASADAVAPAAGATGTTVDAAARSSLRVYLRDYKAPTAA